jgi:multimeric flavodoxin WrbA
MAKILLLLTSARKNGFTAGLLKEAAGAAEKIPGVTVEILHAFDYKFGPCNSCFSCIRHSEKFCSLDDDMGQNGKGICLQTDGYKWIDHRPAGAFWVQPP